MPDIVSKVLILFCLLQIKHMFADFYLQTPRMLSGRSEYKHMGRAQHAAVHAAGTAIALAVIGTPISVLLILVVMEWIVHFHIDWGKARYSEVKNLDPSQAAFWRATGFDQALHQLTYVAIVWAWVVFAGVQQSPLSGGTQ